MRPRHRATVCVTSSLVLVGSLLYSLKKLHVSASVPTRFPGDGGGNASLSGACASAPLQRYPASHDPAYLDHSRRPLV